MATALLGLASPWLAYNRSFFAEPVIGLTAVIALYGLDSERPVLAAIAAAAAAIFKPPLAVIGGGFVIDRMQQRRWHDAILIAAVLAGFGVALLLFNYWLARTFVISAMSADPGPSAPTRRRIFMSLARPSSKAIMVCLSGARGRSSRFSRSDGPSVRATRAPDFSARCRFRWRCSCWS